MHTIRQVKIVANTIVRQKLIRQGIQYFRPLGILTVTYDGTITCFKFVIFPERQNIIYLKIPVLSGFTRYILALEIRTTIGIGLMKIICSIFRIIPIRNISGNLLAFSFKFLLKIKSYIYSQIFFVLL